MISLFFVTILASLAVTTQTKPTQFDSTFAPTKVVVSFPSLNPPINLALVHDKDDGERKDSESLAVNSATAGRVNGDPGLMVRELIDIRSTTASITGASFGSNKFYVPPNGTTLTITITDTPSPTDGMRPILSHPTDPYLSTLSTQDTSNTHFATESLPPAATASFSTMTIPVSNPANESDSPLNLDPFSTQTQGISRSSITAAISILSILAGLTVIIGILLCLRARKLRQSLLAPRPDAEHGLTRPNPASLRRFSFVLNIGPTRELRHQGGGGLVSDLQFPPPSYSSKRQKKPIGGFSTPSTVDVEDWEDISDDSFIEKGETIASSVTSFNLASPIWISRPVGPSMRQSRVVHPQEW